MSEVRIDRVVTSGLVGIGRDGYPTGGVELENNVWVVGDDAEAIVIDASHDAEAIARAVGDREALGILLTHGHEDHVNAALEVAEQLDAHVYLHPADLFLWEQTYGTGTPDFELADGAGFSIAGAEIVALHTPGHTPGSVCFAAPTLGTVFSGDTLFRGGPGATRWDYSSFDQIIASIRSRLFTLPIETSARPGHGESTTIAHEQPDLEAWIARGW
ncbi:MBL fold metallo-hydrolase [Leucobacter sp. wl10]|uniref:MBL fold metallo-hydrolase n=1 Tax=Leucobacter sp. wl10 TaxID=2304677 RepID=UPI000E5B0A82|nr:MBL fold metallo-hydrolase [Leucobacter sp. wl10]RGE19665.1 MBL fold metallo-hydrolase [Leucobacter sp. wl10]